jgi:hypothetical protein
MFIFNLLLTNNFHGQKTNLPKRNSGDWYHSIAVITSKNPVEFEDEKSYPCFVYEYSANGVSFTKGVITQVYRNLVYKINEKYGVLSKIPSQNAFERVNNVEFFKLQTIWNAIEYSHGYQQAFNSLGFTDDLIYFAKYNSRNPRILKIHNEFN